MEKTYIEDEPLQNPQGACTYKLNFNTFLKREVQRQRRQVKRNKRMYRYSVNNRLQGRRNNDRKGKREETGGKGRP